jgi:hypothetical protein
VDIQELMLVGIAFVRKPLPVLALAVSERDHLVICGTELVSSEAHILFWYVASSHRMHTPHRLSLPLHGVNTPADATRDTRNAKEPAYTHSSTHSDDITHLSLLPSSSTFLPPSANIPLPQSLLLSASTDGLVALSDLKETDDEEALKAAESWGQSVAAAGTYTVGGQMRVWARSDMDAVATWEIGKGDDEELEVCCRTLRSSLHTCRPRAHVLALPVAKSCGIRVVKLQDPDVCPA